MASFAQDVTTPIDIPDVAAPNFNQNTSGVQDFATALNLGLQLKNNQDAKAKEAARVQKLGDLNTVVSGTLKSISAQSTQGLSNVQLQRLVSKQTSNLNGADYLYVVEQISKGLGSQAFVNVQKELGEEETIAGVINGRDISAQNYAYNIVGVTNTSEADKAQLNKLDQLSRQFEAKQARIKDSQDGLTDSPTVASFAVFLDNLNDGTTSLSLNTLGNAIQNLTADGNHLSPENLKTLQTVKSGFADAQRQKIDMVTRQYNLSVVGMSKDEGARSKILLDNFVKSSERFTTNVTNMTDEQFSSFTQIAKNLQDSGVIGLHKLMPRMAALGEAGLGNNLSSLFKKMVVISGAGKVLGREMADFMKNPDGLLSVGDVNVGAAAQVAISGVNVDNILDLYQGKAIADARVEDRVAAATDVWNHISSVLETPNGVKDMSEKESDVFGLGVIEILDMAQKDGTPDDLRRANELLTSKGFQMYMGKFKKTHPQEAITLSSYVASSTAIMIEKMFNRNTNLRYDVTTGKVTAKDEPINPSSGGRLGVSSLTASSKKASATKRVNELQDRINNAAQILADNSPALTGDVSAAKNYITSFIPRSQVTGTPPPRDSEVDDAIKQGVTVEDIKEKIGIQEAFDRAAAAVRDTGRNLGKARVETKAQPEPPKTKTLKPEEVKQIDKQVKEEIKVQEEKAAQLSTLSPEELEAFKTIDPKTKELVGSLSPEGKAKFDKLSHKNQVYILSLSPEQIQNIVSGFPHR